MSAMSEENKSPDSKVNSFYAVHFILSCRDRPSDKLLSPTNEEILFDLSSLYVKLLNFSGQTFSNITYHDHNILYHNMICICNITSKDILVFFFYSRYRREKQII